MLISAKTLKGKSEAVKRVNDEVKYLETIEIADKVAKRVRAEVERKIEDAASKGSCSTGNILLGLNMPSCEYKGLVADAYKELYSKSLRYGWERVLAEGGNSRAAKYVHELWNNEVQRLLDDLEALGYSVSVTNSWVNRHKDKVTEATPETLVSNYMMVSW